MVRRYRFWCACLPLTPVELLPLPHVAGAFWCLVISTKPLCCVFLFSEAAQGTCVSNVPNHSEMFDRFEGKLSPLWYKITGGQVGTGCGTLNDGRSLYFNGPGKREARTVPLDTRNIRQVDTCALFREHSIYHALLCSVTEGLYHNVSL